MLLTIKEKSNFYEFICLFEKSIALRFGSFNFQDESLQGFLKSSGIFIARFGNKNEKEAKRYHQYILYNNDKPKRASIKDIKNDSAHNLLRHIRNAMAHGNIDKKSKNSKYYVLKDFSSSKQSMNGLILIQNLFPLIHLLMNSQNK